MGSNKLLAVVMAVFIALNAGVGSVVAATPNDAGGTVQAQMSDVTTITAETGDTTKVDKSLELSTTDGDGNSPEASWSVTGPNKTYSSDGNTSSFSFIPEYAGTYDVSFEVTASGNYSGVDRTVEVTKQKRDTKLTLPNGESSIQPGESVQFKAADGEGNEINGTLESAGHQPVPINGTTEVTFEEEGEFDVTLTPEDTRVYDYVYYAGLHIKTVSVNYDETELDLLVTDSEGNEKSSYTPGTEIRFTSQDTNGNQIPNVTVNVAGETLDTGEDSQVTTSFDSEDEYEATASKEIQDGTEYINGTTNFTVEPETTNLSLTVTDTGDNSGPFTPGTEVKFTVQNANGDAIENATVDAGDYSLETNSNGVATETFDEGEYEATASKDAESTEYDEASANFTVQPETTNLSLKVTDTGDNSGPFTPGTEVKFTVQNANGDAIENATVDAGDYSLETNSNGVATETFDEGEYEATASKDAESTEYDEASANFTVEPETTNLSLTVADTNGNEGPYTPGTEVKFTVQNANGDVIENATVDAGDYSLETNSDGVATATFDEGEYEATASKDAESTVYDEASANFTVEPETTNLSLTVRDANGEVGPFTPADEVKFTVTANGGNAIENATVDVGDYSLETNSDGVATATFDEGEYEATASKDAESTVYDEASANFTVQRETTNLSLSVEDMNGEKGPFTPGTEMWFKVTDEGGNDVENATVDIDGVSETLETDSSGLVSTTLYDEGEREAVASKDQTQTTAFNEASANFTIQPETSNLSLKVRDTNGNEGPYTPGTEVKFTVTDEGGNGVGYATVEAGSRSLRTDSNGVATATFDSEDEYEATASKETEMTVYNEASANFTVQRETSNLSLTVADTNGNEGPYTPGTEVKFTVQNANGDAIENATVDVGDYSLETDSNGVATETFDEGEYEANATKEQTLTTEFNGTSANFTVQPETTNLSLTVADTNGNEGPYMPETEVKFTVKNTNGDTIENATVEVANQTLDTGSNGVATTTFNETGQFEATASKNQTQTVVFNSTTENVSIEYGTEELELTVQDSNGNTGEDIIPNETIEFVVTNSNGDRVPNATVAVDNGTYAVDESGIATANITDVGTFQANASKNITDGVQYVNATETFNVSREEEALDLHVLDSNGNENTSFVPGDVIVFDLDDTDSHSVANASITVANQTLKTDEDGEVNTTVNETGEFVVNATSEPNMTTEFEPTSENITLDRYNESLTLDMLNESGENATEFEPGETVEFVTAPNATVTVDNESYETNANGTVNETFYKNGEYNVTVTKAHNLTTEFQNTSGTFTVNGTELWVNSAINGSDTLSVNETKSGNITLNVAPDGLAGYNVVLTIDDNATFSNASNSSAFDLANVTIRDNGSVVEYDAVDLEKNVQAGDENIDLGTFEIEGESDGMANVSVEIEEIESGNETAVDAGTNGSTVEVIQPPTFNGTAASDPDGDGTYEDLNGNGEVDYSDAIALFENREGDSVQENTELFDFTGDGSVGYSDTISLYEMTPAGS